MNQIVRERLTLQLKIDEGLRRKPYKCTAGKLTIGYGRNLEDNGISMAEAAYLLAHDIDAAELDAVKLPWYEALSDNRKIAVLNMIFNLGLPGFLKFKNTIAFIAAGEWEKAAEGLKASLWYKQVGARAERIIELIREG